MNEKIQSDSLQLVDRAKANLQSLLAEFTYSQDFLIDINTAFGGDFNQLSLEQFYQQWQESNFDNFPEVEIISSTDLNSANGAFSKDTKKIYLAQEFLLANKFDIDAIATVLSEEYGHFVDSQINSIDSPGDEGAIFAKLIGGADLSATELISLQAENDTAFTIIDGKKVHTEYSFSLTDIIINTEHKLSFIADYDEGYYYDGPGPGPLYGIGNSAVGGTGGSSEIETVWDEASENYISLGTYTIQDNGEISATSILDPIEIGEESKKLGEINSTVTANLLENSGSISYSIQANPFDGEIKSLTKNYIERGRAYNDFNEYRHYIGTDAWIDLAYEINVGEGYFSIVGDGRTIWDLIPNMPEVDRWEFYEFGSINDLPPENSEDSDLEEFDSGNFSNTESVYIEQPGNYLLRLNIQDEIEAKTLNGNLNWTFTPFTNSEVEFNFTDLVIEGTEGETKQIGVTRISEDVSQEETVEIEIAAASETRELLSNLYSDFSTAEGIKGGGDEINKILKEASDNIVDEIADSAGEPKNSPNRISNSRKLFNVLSKLISPAEIAEAAYSQARATNSDIFPEELSVTFAPGQAKATTDLQFFNDTDEEGDEFLFLELFQNGKDLESPDAVVAIRDDDQPGVVNLGDGSGLASIVADGLIGVAVGAVRGFFGGGGLVGTVGGGFLGGLSGAAKATVEEILKDLVQKAIVESIVSYKSGDNNNLSNLTETIEGTDGDDTISGGDGEDLLKGGMGADSLSGGRGSDIFGGSLEELNMDRIIDFSSEDVLQLQNTNFTQESLTVTQGSAILDIDTDLDGITDSTIILEGDFADAEFLVEPVSIEGITETYITINDPTPRPETEGRGSIVDRFFNPAAGVHFYTADPDESDFVRNNLANYNYEGESYVTVDPVSGNNPEEVYRFFNSTTGVHLYTTNEEERDYIIDNLSNFAYEDVKFHAYETEVEGSIPVHRFYEPTIGVHFYTPNEGEKTYIEENLFNYTYEGIAYYAFAIDNTEIV